MPYLNRGAIYADSNQPDKAILDFTEAIRVNPKESKAYFNRALKYTQKQEIEKAIADYTHAIRIDPNYNQALENRGVLFQHSKAYDRALADYRQAMKVNPQSALAWNNVAWMLAASPIDTMRDGKKAVEYARRACDLSSWKDANIIGTLAGAYAEAGDFKAASEVGEESPGDWL